MKATGIIRPLDQLGRIVLPIELRRVLNIANGDKVEIFTDDNGYIMLRKFRFQGEVNEAIGVIGNYVGELPPVKAAEVKKHLAQISSLMNAGE